MAITEHPRFVFDPLDKAIGRAFTEADRLTLFDETPDEIRAIRDDLNAVRSRLYAAIKAVPDEA